MRSSGFVVQNQNISCGNGENTAQLDSINQKHLDDKPLIRQNHIINKILSFLKSLINMDHSKK